MKFFYVFCNGSFYGYYAEKNFHNSVMYNQFMTAESFKVYSVIVEY